MMKAILFILILFINIFENVATGEDEDGGGPSQRKDKRPLEIIDLSSESNSPNTDGEEHIGMNPESWPNAHFDSLTNTLRREFLPHQRGIKIGGEGGQTKPSKKPKFSEPKMTYIDNSTKQIKVDDSMDFEHIVQQLTGKNADVKEISLEHGDIPKRLFPVSLLQQKFGTSLIGQNIGQSQQYSHSETVENRENTHYPIPLSFYDPQEGMVRTWHQFPQWRQEQREKQENLEQDFAGIILESSSANSLANFNFKETGKNALVNDNHEIIHQQNSLEIHKTQSSNSLNHYLQKQEKKLGEQIGARIGQGSSSPAFGIQGHHQQIQANMKENENDKPSKRGARLNYKEVFRFNNEKQFKEWIKLSNWTKCKYYQRKGYKCLARLKVIRPDSDIIIVEESDIKHDHRPIQ